MLATSRSFTLLLFALLASCGGGVTDTGNAGNAGSGGSSGSTSGGSAGSTGQTECPPTEPPAGEACGLPDNWMCTYGGCCGTLKVCVDGKWEQGFVDCAPADCPAEPPAAGTACGECALYQESPCGYPCDQGTSILATCNAGLWEITSSTCPEPCGEMTCAPEEICVETAGGPGVSYACAENPCGGEPLTCGCAGELCGGAPYECHIQSGTHVSCVCPDCP